MRRGALFTLANFISLSRLILALAFVLFDGRWERTILILAAGATDFLDGWFARNPATPRDVLDRIAGTSTSTWAISQLPQNPAFDCAMLEQAERNLRGRGSPSDSAAITLTQIEELRPTVCAKRPRV